MFDGADKPAEPAPVQQDPLEIAIALEWQSAQLAQQHVVEALNKLLDARRKDRDILAAAVARIDELDAEVKERDARIDELSRRLIADG